MTSSSTVVSVLTIADLQALSASETATFVSVESYLPISSYSDGVPKGGGRFWLDSTSTATLDNGVTIIDNPINMATPSNKRHWKLIHDGEIMLSQAGCRIDGVHSDSVELNRAIATLNKSSENVNVLWSDVGKMILTVEPDPILRSNTSILGFGWSASKWSMQNSTAGVGRFLQIGDDTNKVSRMAIRDIGFFNDVGPPLNNLVFAIWFRNCTIVNVIACHFSDCSQVARFGGTTVGNAAGRVSLIGCHGQPAMGPESSSGALNVFRFESATEIMMTGCQWFRGGNPDTPVPIPNARYLAFVPSPLGDGIDGCVFTGNVWNFNGTDMAYGIEFDATNNGIANARFANNTLDGGLQYAHLYKIGSTAPQDYCRIYNISFTGNQISASTNYAVAIPEPPFISYDGGGGVYVDHQVGNYIHGIAYAANICSIGSKEIFKHVRLNAAKVNQTGFTFSGNTFSNNSKLGPSRIGFVTQGDGLVVTGNRFGATKEDVDIAPGANFWTFALKLEPGADGVVPTSVVFQGNDVSRISEVYPVDCSLLPPAGMGTGPIVSGNSGKSDSPERKVQTATAVVTTLGTYSIADGKTVLLTALVVAKQIGGTNRAAYTVSAVASATSGVVTIHSGSAATVNYESDSSWNCTVDASSSLIRIRVTGWSVTIDWYLFNVHVQLI